MKKEKYTTHNRAVRGQSDASSPCLQSGSGNRMGFRKLMALGTAVVFTWSMCVSPVMAETINLEGGTVEVNTQENTTNWNVTGNPVWNVPEFNVPQNSIYNITGLNPNASLALLVNGGQATNIFGTMNLANLDFILQNLAGINIGASAMINLNNASLLASTIPLNLNATDFFARQYAFSGEGGFLTNDGKIVGNNADLVALIANAIENTGTIEVPMGTVALAAGNTVTVGISPDGMVSIGVDEATANKLGLESQIKNTGTISADGGKVILNAQAMDGLFEKAINIASEPNATAVVVSDDGVIEFVAKGSILNDGTVRAERGKIDIRAEGDIEVPGVLEANSGNGQTGEIKLDAAENLRFTGEIETKGATVTFNAQKAMYAHGIVDAGNGYLQICAKEGLDMGGAYAAGQILIDPVDVNITEDSVYTGDTVIWASNDINISANVTVSDGADGYSSIGFYADAIDAIGAKDDGVGRFNQTAGQIHAA